MPLLLRLRSTAARRTARPAAPSCRGGASSLLRLAQPGAARLPSSLQVDHWASRAVNALMGSTAGVPPAFAPSQFIA
jgi:hypothetical protein